MSPGNTFAVVFFADRRCLFLLMSLGRGSCAVNPCLRHFISSQSFLTTNSNASPDAFAVSLCPSLSHENRNVRIKCPSLLRHTVTRVRIGKGKKKVFRMPVTSGERETHGDNRFFTYQSGRSFAKCVLCFFIPISFGLLVVASLLTIAPQEQEECVSDMKDGQQ